MKKEYLDIKIGKTIKRQFLKVGVNSYMLSKFKTIIIFFTFVIISFTIQNSVNADVKLDQKGRWLRINGKNPYLVGMDAQTIACNPRLNFKKILNSFQKYNINKVRIWLYCVFGTHHGLLHPWKEVEKGKYNLDAWDNEYWSRLRHFLEEADNRNIVVEVSIFSVNFVHKKSHWLNKQWRPIWNSENNVNGVFSTNINGHFVPEFFALDYPEVSKTGKKLIDYQKELIDKTVKEIGNFKNIYFEICNEFPGFADVHRVYKWQQYWAEYLKKIAPERLVGVHAHEFGKSHTKGIEYWTDEPYIDILNFHFYEYNPQIISDLLNKVQKKRKVISVNESGMYFKRKRKLFGLYKTNWQLEINRLNRNMRMAYGMLLSGGYFSLYVESDKKIGDKDWAAGGERLKILRNIAESVKFWEMSPVDIDGNEFDSLISEGPTKGNWQVMADPGKEYLAYFWGDRWSRRIKVPVKIDLPAQNYNFEWYNTENGIQLLNGNVRGKKGSIIPVPDFHSWREETGAVLIIKKK